jgi:formimidoylglutamate deiminase
MTHIFARKALIQKGWADNVRLSVRAGRIASVSEGVAAESSDIVAGVLIPGLCNAHSHAFQRALAGRTEKRSPAGKDNFWTWRERMYELAASLDAAALTAIARQAYSEMLTSGYTAVAEFHYLHRQPGAEAGDNAMYRALLEAAADTGIRLTYVPVHYERAGFGSPEPQGHQALFAQDIEQFLQHHAYAVDQAPSTVHVAIGAHSLRAVSRQSLQRIAAAADTLGCPLHLHIAEQQREVDDCMTHYGRRPVRWLLENFDVDRRWCLVHATHMDKEETAAAARSGAVACLCPSTEANLGDGLFPLHDYLENGGQIAIGSDSHITINPFEELRWLEYGQRLATQSRNIAALQQSHVGRELYTRALQGGLRAGGHEERGIAAGSVADLVLLDDGDPMLAGHGAASLLDALVFSGYRLPIERVMVNGEWRVVDGDHLDRAATSHAYAETLQRIGVNS